MRPRYTPYFIPALLAALLFLNYLYLVNLSQKSSEQKEEEAEETVAIAKFPRLNEEYALTLGLKPQKAIKFKTKGPAKSERIISFLLSERMKVKGNFKKLATSKEMNAFLATIKQEELLFLATLVLDPSMDRDSRRISLYVLTSSLPQSVLGLVEIASMPMEKGLDAEEKSFELGLRLGALLALDTLPKEPKMKEAFQRVFTQANHPDLRSLALAAITSWDSKRPQRLDRLVKKITWKTQANGKQL